jgi:hypothetical protein
MSARIPQPILSLPGDDPATRLVKILVGPSERAMPDPQGSMMDPYDARAISLGTLAGICARSRQSRIVAA